MNLTRLLMKMKQVITLSGAMLLIGMLAMANQGMANANAYMSNAQVPAKPAQHAVAASAGAKGVSKCQNRIDNLASKMTANGEFGGTLFTSPEAPDERIVSASLELRTQGVLQYGSLTFAPGQAAGKCSGLTELVTFWNNDCKTVAAKLYPEAQAAKAVDEKIATLKAGATTRIYLMAAGNGCLAIKKEMEF